MQVAGPPSQKNHFFLQNNKFGWTLTQFFYRAMHMHKRGICCHPLSVCLSVAFRSCAKTNKDIFEIFSPSGSDTILVFPYQRGCRYSDGNPPNGSVEYKGV